MRSQNGNVLFLILIAVSLFAALSFVATRTGRNSGDTLSKEKADLLAAEIISYAAQMEQAVSRMILINKVPEYGMDVSASVYSNSTANATCTTDTCKLFNLVGGNISAKLLPQKAWDMNNVNMTGTWVGKIQFIALTVQDVGSEQPELMMAYPGLNKEACLAINERVNIPNVSNAPPTDSYSAGGFFTPYSGTMTAFPSISGISIGDTATVVRGKRTFCLQNGSGYFFWHVLMAR